MRSFLRHDGYNALPRVELSYTPQVWHHGYRKHEIQRLLGYLPPKLHKLFVYIAAETGLRADTILELRYRHIMEDFEATIVPTAVRLEPRFCTGRKAAGYAVVDRKSLEMMRECLDEGLVEASANSRLVPKGCYAGYAAVYRAKREARQSRVFNPVMGSGNILRMPWTKQA